LECGVLKHRFKICGWGVRLGQTRRKRPWVRRAVPLAVLGLGLLGAVGPACPPVLAQQAAPSGDQSWAGSISSGVKKGFDKLGNAVTPKPAPESTLSKDDPVSLKSKAKAGPELNVAVARVFAEAKNYPEADQQYRLALRRNPNYLPALLGYAELKDELGRPGEAQQLYQLALKAHPKQPAVYNNYGLCYARHGQLDEAVETITKATELDPRNVLYRNNVAAILIEQGRLREAFRHLKAVHGDAVAYYNIGYMLYKRGKPQAAMMHFAWALQKDPSMVAARRWIDYLQYSAAQARAPQPRTDVRIAEAAPSQPDPQQQPPPETRGPAPDGPSLPGISYSRPAAPPRAE
jgi:tetratricopeptide (TPR) repeat protein